MCSSLNFDFSFSFNFIRPKLSDDILDIVDCCYIVCHPLCSAFKSDVFVTWTGSRT